MNRVVLQINQGNNGENTQPSDALSDNLRNTLALAANTTVNHPKVLAAMGFCGTDDAAGNVGDAGNVGNGNVGDGNGVSFVVDLTLLDEPQMQHLNNTYRQINKPTDVLTFPLFDQQEVGSEIRQLTQLQHSAPCPLGDIAICTPIAHKQSQDLCHSYDTEVAFLLIHGMLHLLGFDHIHDHHSNVMLPLQSEILSSLNI